jgi:hypothetical protein
MTAELLLADIYLPFFHAWPGGFSSAARLASFLPLIFCVALVYRATRVRHAHELWRGTLITFGNTTLGMAAIGVGLFVLYELVIRFG